VQSKHISQSPSANGVVSGVVTWEPFNTFSSLLHCSDVWHHDDITRESCGEQYISETKQTTPEQTIWWKTVRCGWKLWKKRVGDYYIVKHTSCVFWVEAVFYVCSGLPLWCQQCPLLQTVWFVVFQSNLSQKTSSVIQWGTQEIKFEQSEMKWKSTFW